MRIWRSRRGLRASLRKRAAPHCMPHVAICSCLVRRARKLIIRCSTRCCRWPTAENCGRRVSRSTNRARPSTEFCVGATAERRGRPTAGLEQTGLRRRHRVRYACCLEQTFGSRGLPRCLLCRGECKCHGRPIFRHYVVSLSSLCRSMFRIFLVPLASLCN